MLILKTELDKVLKLTHPCRCRKCENSCNYGSGAFADGEVKKLAESMNMNEEELKKEYLEEIQRFNTKRLRPKLLREEGKPYGKCVFYDKNLGCKIHEVKPLECKIAMGCKSYGEELITWFDLNYFLNAKDLESLRQFKEYVESGGKVLPGAEMTNLIDEKTMKKLESYEDLKDNTDWEEVLGLKDIKK